MKPEQGRVQAATQVKGLSSENVNISEADPIHVWGRRNSKTVNGQVVVTLTESETAAWNQEDNPGTWETQSVVQKFGLRRDKP